MITVLKSGSSCLILLLMLIQTFAQDPQFQVHMHQAQLSENNVRYELYLLFPPKEDSLLVSKTQRHDLGPPVYFWSKNQKYLIYESDQSFGNAAKIHVLDPTYPKIIYETPGFFQISTNQISHLLDAEHDILFFFQVKETIQQRKIALYQLELSTFKGACLYEFPCIDDYERPLLEVDTVQRLLKVSYTCQESGKADVSRISEVLTY